MKKRKNRSRRRVGLLIILFLLISPYLAHQIRQAESELVSVPEIDSMTRVDNIDVEEFLSDKPNAIIIFYNPEDRKINEKLFRYLKENNGQLDIEGTIYLNVMTETPKEMRELYGLKSGQITVGYFEKQKMVNVFTITDNTKLTRDFEDKIHALAEK